jgi:hypothetical protein
MFITAFTAALHLSLSWARRIQSTLPHPISPRSISIFSTHLRLGLPSGLLSPDFPTNNLCAFFPPPHSCYMSRPSFWLHRSNYAWRLAVTQQLSETYSEWTRISVADPKLSTAVWNLFPYSEPVQFACPLLTYAGVAVAMYRNAWNVKNGCLWIESFCVAALRHNHHSLSLQFDSFPINWSTLYTPNQFAEDLMRENIIVKHISNIQLSC